MEELSIEQKAKRYDEAIKKAEVLYKTAEPMSGCNVLLETVFPELAESDEKIRKALINGFNKLDKSAVWYNGITNAQILDWLEKQGEHANFRNKIQIGDKVTRNRDGVLVNLSQLNRIAKVEEKQGEQKPTDEEMKELLQTEYEKGRTDAIAEIQKPAWSEEDEEMLKMVIKLCEQCGNEYAYYWLKSLKDRIQPQQEWSDEDENTRKKIIKFLKEQNYFDGKANEFKEPYKKEYEWLKSLRPQPQWKPSAFHLECIEDAISLYEKRGINAIGLKEILEELKKLK